MNELPSIFNSTEVKAIKNHVCNECNNKIKKGTSYYRINGLWEGSWSNFKQCNNCYEIMECAESFSDSGEGPCFGSLRDWFFEFICIDLKGDKFLNQMASDIGVTTKNLNKLLKLKENIK